MKNTYIAVTVQENDKNIAYVLKVSSSENIVSALKIKGLIFGNICSTKKAAHELVDFWNESYKKNGSYSLNVLL